jgi:hypothetical protein
MASDKEKYSFKDEEIKNIEKIIEDRKNFQKRLEIKKESEHTRNLSKLNDVFTLVLVSYIDLSIGRKYLIISKVKREQMFFIKNIYLTIYETIETYNGNSKLLKENSERDDEIKECFRSVGKKLRNFNKEYNFKDIKNVRDKVSAHMDIKYFHQEIIDTDTDRIHNMIVTFRNDFLVEVIILLNKIVSSNLSLLKNGNNYL